MTQSKECINCGKIYTRKGLSYQPTNKEWDNKKFCSRKCYREHREANHKVTLSCEICGQEFTVPKCYKNRRVTCSEECYKKWLSKTMSGEKHPNWNSVELTCPVCGDTFYRKKSKVREITYCSHSCSAKAHSGKNNPAWNKVKVTCCNCEKEIYKIKSRVTDSNYCSMECYNEAKIGKGNPNWKNGKLSLHIRLRGLGEYYQWVEKVLKRDNYICQECGKRGGDLEAHHIKHYSDILDEFLEEYNQFSPIEDKETLVRLAIKYKPLWDIDNGKTLCLDCHNEIHSVKLKGDN